MSINDTTPSYLTRQCAGMAVDPIYVGSGGTRLGRVDNTIVRDPVTQVPKIPGSSYAGVARAYAAMAKGRYPGCAGQGQPENRQSHCGEADCPICTVFGFAAREGGGFAGLGAFSDMHLLLHPVATREGPVWVTAPMVLREQLGVDIAIEDRETAYCIPDRGAGSPLNLGWLMLKRESLGSDSGLDPALSRLGVPEYIRERAVVVADSLFAHVVNSNLEVRTSVAIDPATGAADEGALFTYEALPRSTVLVWSLISRNPAHFKVRGEEVRAVSTPDEVAEVVRQADPFLESLGIGGMGTRGMGRLRVLGDRKPDGEEPPGGSR